MSRKEIRSVGDPARAQKGLDPRVGIKVIFQGTRSYSRRDERRPPAFALGAISGEDSKERIEVTEIEILQIRDGEIIQKRGVVDNLSALRQLGVIPSPRF